MRWLRAAGLCPQDGRLDMIDNSVSEYLYALRKDCPGKTWWNADFVNRAPVYRALRINQEEEGAGYAITPFRVHNLNGRWLILAAYPAPHVFEPTPDWFEIDTVIAWDPNSDAASLLGDPVPQLAGNLTEQANQIHASPRAFFQAWAMRRAQFATQRQTAQERRWHISPRERDDVPGALLIGELAKVRLNPSDMPAHIECVGVDPKELNKAIMRAARLPRASAAAQTLRRAA
jgi:hypothetical protein